MMTPYKPKPSPEVVAAPKRSAISEALLELFIKEKTEKLTIKCGLSALAQILLMPDCMRTMDDAFLQIAGCVIQVKRDLELEPWHIIYNNEVLFSF